MINFLVKSVLIIGSCGSAAFLSTQWARPEGAATLRKVNSNDQGKILKSVNRIEDIDVWGKQHGCSFIFVKNWKEKEIYTATGYAKASGGKETKLTPVEHGLKTKTKFNTLEEAIVGAVNEYKDFCVNKLRTFTFLWREEEKKFYIGDPDQVPKLNKTHFYF